MSINKYVVILLVVLVGGVGAYMYLNNGVNESIIQLFQEETPSVEAEIVYYQNSGVKVYEAYFDNWYHAYCPGSAHYGANVSWIELRDKVSMTKGYFADEIPSWEVEVFTNPEHNMLWAICYNTSDLSRLDLCVWGNYSSLTQCVFTVNTESPYLTDEEEYELRGLIFHNKNEASSTWYVKKYMKDRDIDYDAEMEILDAYVQAVLSGERPIYKSVNVKTIINYTLTHDEAETYNIQEGSDDPSLSYQLSIRSGNQSLSSYYSIRPTSEKFKAVKNGLLIEYFSNELSFGSGRYQEMEIQSSAWHLELPKNVGTLTVTIIAYNPDTEEQTIIATNSTIDPRNIRVTAKGLLP